MSERLTTEQIEILKFCKSDKWALTTRDVQPVVTSLVELGHLVAEPTKMLIGGLYYRITDAGRALLRSIEGGERG